MLVGSLFGGGGLEEAFCLVGGGFVGEVVVLGLWYLIEREIEGVKLDWTVGGKS